MFPLLIPLAVEAVEVVGASYTAWRLAKTVKTALRVSKTAKLGKYARASKNVSRYSKNRKTSLSDRALNVGGGLDMLGTFEGVSRQGLERALSDYRSSRSGSSPIANPNANISFPEYNGETLIDALKHSSDTHSIANERIINSMNLQSQMLSEIGTAIQSGSLVFSTLLPQIYSALVGISASLDNNASINMPKSRLDFYSKHNAIADYKMSPASHTDMFGNDGITMSPLDIQTKKNLGDAVATSLENETTIEDIDMSDLLPDMDISNISADVSKLFGFNGVYDTLQQLVANMGEDGQGFASPTLKG
jgi:hypothetical protein